jgi:hypothetical protein
MRFESKKNLKKKLEKYKFYKLESLFFFMLLFHSFFPLHFKDDF